jgi:TetR/AcrR family transcriptional regulator, transcriptional repressor for nem operon
VGTTATNRRVGAETSKTRDAILDAVEGLLLDEGYAGVSYRAVGTKAAVKPSLIQYYFPSLDSMFAALIRRMIESDIDRWTKAFDARPDEPLRVLWEYSRSEAAGGMSMELMALGNHRPTVRAEITNGTERIRRIQLKALASKYGDSTYLDNRFTPDAMVLLLTSMPKYLSLEDGIEVDMGHRRLIAAFETYLDGIEPNPRARKATSPKHSRAKKATSPARSRARA